MDSCLLCLQINIDLLDSMKANSIRWQQLNVKQVIEKHFWPLNTILSSSWLCLTCWQELYDFHKFYTRIEETHANFGKLIKVEDETHSPEYKEDLISQNEDNGERLNIEHGYLEPEILIDQRSPPGNLAIENIEQIQIKLEPVDLNDNDSKSSNDDNCQEDKDSLEIAEVKKNSASRKQRIILKENDKFIAEHFKQMFCNICLVPFEHFPAMQKHFKDVHNQRGYVVCCKRKFFDRNRLVDHIHCHLNPDHFKCVDCDKVMSDRISYESHMLRIHRASEVVKQHVCDICGKSFIKASALRIHKLTHLPEDEKKFPCTDCGKPFGSSLLLNHHRQAVHLKRFTKICYICGKSLRSSAEYKVHMNKHEGVPAPVIHCDICGLRLASVRGLRKHKKSIHPVGGKREHCCPICPKISTTPEALKKHIKIIHEKGYDHKCSLCEKAFKRPESLKEHMATHTGIALYTCSWCPQTFKSSGNINAHRKRNHPKEWEEAKLQKYSGLLLPQFKEQS